MKQNAMIGKRIRAIRTAKKMRQDELAEKIGIGKSSVSEWESGKRLPRTEYLPQIAQALEVSVWELVSARGEAPGAGGADLPANAMPVERLKNVQVVGAVRCGAGGVALEEPDGYEMADVANPEEYFFLRAVGDSMEPKISEGDLALVHRQEDVESGELAVVIIDGEEGTLKKVIKKEGAVILQAFNPEYPPRVFTGQEMAQLCIAGKVVMTERKW